MSQEPQYIVRDSAGVIYGPATVATLRQWIGEGRITAQMEIALQGTQSFSPAGQMAELAGAFAGVAPVSGANMAGSGAMAAGPTQIQTLGQSPAGGMSGPGGQGGPGSIPRGQPYYGYSKNSGMAMTSMICGFLGLFTCVGAILAVIFGHMARGQIRREPERYEGSGMALVGLILGYSYLLVLALILVLWLVVVIVLLVVAPPH